MTMQTCLKTAAAAACGLMLAMQAPCAAAAAVSSGASVTNVQFHVVDLTPDDGQAGGITYYKRESSLTAVAGNIPDDKDYNDWVAASVFKSSGTDRASMTHSGTPGEIQSYAEANSGVTAAYGFQDGYLWLLPHTSLSMTGHMSGFVRSVSGLSYASAVSDSIVSFYKGDCVPCTLAEARKEVTLDSSPYGASYDEDFNLSYANNTDKAIALTWSNYQYINAGTTLPVPEPEGYAMLAAGLLVLGAVARRRHITKS